MKTSAKVLFAWLVVWGLAYGSWMEIGFAQNHALDEITVTGSRLPGFTGLRSVEILSREEIDRSGVTSLDALLEYVLSLDVQNRGVFGVQADLGARGSQFQQVALLIDGVPMRNPQTAHHNLNIPVSLADVERIEILRGHGSTLYGPDAFGGTIHILTRNQGSLAEIRSGEYGLRGYSLRGALGNDTLGFHASAERMVSDGYSEGTDFDVLNMRAGLTAAHHRGTLHASVGLQDKDFGAFDFYTPGAGLASIEGIDTLSTQLEHQFTSSTWIAISRGYWNHGNDHFILDRTGAINFSSRHTTDQWGLEQTLQYHEALLGLSAEWDEITSQNLGDHQRARLGIFGEWGRRWRLGAFHTGLRFDHYAQGWIGSPTVSARWRAFRISVGRAFRIPSYTELYYESPQNLGNADLAAEDAWSYELGWDWRMLNLNAYQRREQNVIDWVRHTEDEPWRAQNLRDLTSTGAEAMARWRALSVGYAVRHVDTDIPDGLQSKYVLHTWDRQAVARFSNDLPFGLNQHLQVSYKERLDENVWLADWSLHRAWGPLGVRLSIMNLFDVHYEEVLGVPQPGRWFYWAVRWEGR